MKKIFDVVCLCIGKVFCMCRDRVRSPEYGDTYEYWKAMEHIDEFYIKKRP